MFHKHGCMIGLIGCQNRNAAASAKCILLHISMDIINIQNLCVSHWGCIILQKNSLYWRHSRYGKFAFTSKWLSDPCGRAFGGNPHDCRCNLAYSGVWLQFQRMMCHPNCVPIIDVYWVQSLLCLLPSLL